MKVSMAHIEITLHIIPLYIVIPFKMRLTVVLTRFAACLQT